MRIVRLEIRSQFIFSLIPRAFVSFFLYDYKYLFFQVKKTCNFSLKIPKCDGNNFFLILPPTLLKLDIFNIALNMIKLFFFERFLLSKPSHIFIIFSADNSLLSMCIFLEIISGILFN